MDGTAMPLTSFTEHQSNLALALPAPRLARGVGHSGDPPFHKFDICTLVVSLYIPFVFPYIYPLSITF